jgi:tRNA threonylcarbamoyladenosine biosynthesis protein TsaE
MRCITYQAPDEAATAALGAVLAEILPDGTVVALCGTLGAGKTRLVQAIAESIGADRRQVVSPTFVLMQHYEGRRQIEHLDAYRIRSEEEFLDLGTDELFETGALVLIEWADRVAGCLPRERIEIQIEVTGHQTRRIEVCSTAPRYDPVIERLQRAIEQKESL